MGPLLVTTLEPDEEIDPNKLIFTGSWCYPSDNASNGVTNVTHIPNLDAEDDVRVSSNKYGPTMPLLGSRRSDESSLDDGISDDYSQYRR
jgi:hypothetical protein